MYILHMIINEEEAEENREIRFPSVFSIFSLSFFS